MSLHEPHALPWKELLIPQIVNFTAFIGLLVYFVSRPLKQHFAEKSQQFETQRRLAESSRVEAEKKNFDAHRQLKDLEDTSSQAIADARNDANKIKENLLAEAKADAQKTAAEADKMAQYESVRAMAALRSELILSATSMAETTLKSDAGEKIQQKLGDEFVSKIQAASL